ncbi:MAG: DNA polymerase III subunit delta [Mariprofundaceae bacterium]|nr:DNA polymerase III subunit delta [Mariprofundaceae bacterium]
MKIAPTQLTRLEHRCYYLSGEDSDALSEAADILLAVGDAQAIRLRLDVSELSRIEEESRNQGLFGSTVCYALVRNAGSASPKQMAYLLTLATSVLPGNRLIICAAEISWKKALHKKMLSLSDVAHCEFKHVDVRVFHHWLQDEIEKAGLTIHSYALPLISEQLCGMRLAARQWIERLKLYDGGKGEELSQEVLMALLGEHAPDDLDIWVHTVAMKDKAALRLVLRLLHDQKVSEIQLHAWLSTRFQQLLMYRWYQMKGDHNPLQTAKVFGDARKKIPQEARLWKGAELSKAVSALQQTEILLKGASTERKTVLMERLVLCLIEKNPVP